MVRCSVLSYETEKLWLLLHAEGYRDSIKKKAILTYIDVREVSMDKLFEEIARMAFELYEKRGKADGFHLDDWLEAERIVLARHEKKKEKGEHGDVKPAKRKTTARKPKEEKATSARKETPKRKPAGKKTSTTKKTT
jgi:hypothetical protein